MYVLVVILLIIILVFGVASGMDAYASSRQAQASIEQAKAMSEVAQVAQVNAWGNLITILTLALVIIAVVGLIIAFVLINTKHSRRRNAPGALPNSGQRHEELPISINELIQLQMLKTLQSMNGQPQLQSGDQSEEHYLEWLREQ